MSSLLIKNADAIVTCDSQDAVLEHANLLMQDGIITYIGIEPQTKSLTERDVSFIQD